MHLNAIFQALWFCFFSFCCCCLSFFLFLLSNGENETPNHTLCIIQGVGLQFFGCSVLCWYFCIALHLYLFVVRKYEVKKSLYFHVFSWGVPAILTIIPYYCDAIELAGVWCWLTTKDSHTWEWTCFYGEMAIICILTSYMWFSLVITVGRTISAVGLVEYEKRRVAPYKHMIRHILLVAIVFLIFVVTFTNRLYQSANNKHASFILTMLSAIAISSPGFISFSIFFPTHHNLRLWKQFFCNLKFKWQGRYETISG